MEQRDPAGFHASIDRDDNVGVDLDLAIFVADLDATGTDRDVDLSIIEIKVLDNGEAENGDLKASNLLGGVDARLDPDARQRVELDAVDPLDDRSDADARLDHLSRGDLEVAIERAKTY